MNKELVFSWRAQTQLSASLAGPRVC